MDMELTLIHLNQDFEANAEEYEAAASNERLWAKGSDDAETAQMHEENAEHCMMMAQMYRRMAKHAEDIFNKYVEGEV